MLSKYINSTCKKIVATTLALTLTFSAVTFTPYHLCDSKILNADATEVEENEFSEEETEILEILNQISDLQAAAQQKSDESIKIFNQLEQALQTRDENNDTMEIYKKIEEQYKKLISENSELHRQIDSLMDKVGKLTNANLVSSAIQECRDTINENPNDIDGAYAAINKSEKKLRSIMKDTVNEDLANKLVDKHTDELKDLIDEKVDSEETSEIKEIVDITYYEMEDDLIDILSEDEEEIDYIEKKVKTYEYYKNRGQLEEKSEELEESSEELSEKILEHKEKYEVLAQKKNKYREIEKNLNEKKDKLEQYNNQTKKDKDLQQSIDKLEYEIKEYSFDLNSLDEIIKKLSSEIEVLEDEIDRLEYDVYDLSTELRYFKQLEDEIEASPSLSDED